MKKISLLFLVVLIVNIKAIAIPRVGAELGLNFSKMSYDLGGVSANTTNHTGIRLGLIVDAKLHGHFHIQPGLFYSMEGTNISGGGSVTPSYLRIPVNVLYRLGLPGVGHIYFGAGPVFGYCLGGKIDNGNGSTSLKVGSDAAKDDIKGTDMGFNINAGYQLPKSLFFRAAYIFGMSNDAPFSGGTIKNSSIVISIGWMFGGLI